MIFQLFVLKHLTKILCLFFLCFRPCSMLKHKLMPPVCSKRIHRRIHFIWFSNVFSQKILINCVSLFLMLFSMFRSESLAIACSVLYHFDQLFGHRSRWPSKRRLGRFVTGHNSDQRDGQKFSVPVAHQLLVPQKSAEEMSRMSHLISGAEEMLISLWRSQVTRGEE